jgi:hypothetical protein
MLVIEGTIGHRIENRRFVSILKFTMNSPEKIWWSVACIVTKQERFSLDEILQQ